MGIGSVRPNEPVFNGISEGKHFLGNSPFWMQMMMRWLLAMTLKSGYGPEAGVEMRSGHCFSGAYGC